LIRFANSVVTSNTFQAKNPGTGWLANSTSSSSRRLDESAFSADFARPLEVETSSLAAARHSSLPTLNQIMVFGVGLASGCFSFFVAGKGYHYQRGFFVSPWFYF
jgi:hypothetical protein